MDIAIKNPFVGLRAFEESEDYLFFGRSAEINDLLKKFAGSRFLAVIGSSGSGKSSLVKSGLLPAIYSGFLSVGHNWRVALMKPGNDPVGNLAKELAKEKVLYENVEGSGIPYQPIIESTLRRSGNGLTQVYKEARLAASENLLIVADQFEELFRFSKYEKQSNQGISDSLNFINLLLTASQQNECPVYILLTMRSDFLGDCSQFRGLPEAINEGQYLVPRMTRDEVKEAITGPISVGGAKITQRLLTRLLNDVGNDIDQLPILQHAMMRTWNAWEKRNKPDEPIDIEDYEKIGTMQSALSMHAEEVFSELNTDRERQSCELMFKALTSKSEDVRGIRRPMSISELCILTRGSQQEIKNLVEIFRKPGRTFLMPPYGVDISDDTVIDISHESLMRIWGRLINWTEEEARSGDLYMRLANSAQLKEMGQRGLLKDPELEIALQWKKLNKPTAKWAEGYKVNFEQTMVYLEDSRVKDLEEKKIIAKKEATRRRLVGTIFAILGLLVVAGFITVIIFNKKTNEAVIAKNEALAAKAEAEIAKNKALLSDSISRVALYNAKLSDSLARRSRDMALSERERADASAKLAKLRENEAIESAALARIAQEIAESEKKNAEKLKEEAYTNSIKNASSEYARLIREGPTNQKEILAENFHYKLVAYTEHLDKLKPLVEGTNDQVAIKKYDALINRLYYNNDLYEKIYACYVTNTNTKEKLFESFSFKEKINSERAPDASDYEIIKKELLLSGKKIIKAIEDKKDHQIICSTDDNWIYVYSKSNNAVTLENKIPMGAQVNALDYSSEKNIIYFGLESGNIGYIEYKNDKKNQPVFENFLSTPVIAIQLFKTTVKGEQGNFLLAAGKNSKVVVYQLDENTLKPDKNLFGNLLPEKKLGELTDAYYDDKLQRVEIWAKSGKSTLQTTYRWNPFTALALDEYKKINTDPKYFSSTKIY